MNSGGELGNLKDGELEAWMIQHLLSLGITPQMWHRDYNSLNDKLTDTHKLDIIRLRSWKNERK